LFKNIRNKKKHPVKLPKMSPRDVKTFFLYFIFA